MFQRAADVQELTTHFKSNHKYLTNISERQLSYLIFAWLSVGEDVLNEMVNKAAADAAAALKAAEDAAALLTAERDQALEMFADEQSAAVTAAEESTLELGMLQRERDEALAELALSQNELESLQLVVEQQKKELESLAGDLAAVEEALRIKTDELDKLEPLRVEHFMQLVRKLVKSKVSAQPA